MNFPKRLDPAGALQWLSGGRDTCGCVLAAQKMLGCLPFTITQSKPAPVQGQQHPALQEPWELSVSHTGYRT